jgi:predicted DsbA family dithiol-disulfide isomerase
MQIDIYADVVCPWCYIGERRLEQALAQRPELHVERRWRPFQLQPGMPKQGLPWAEFATRKFGGGANMDRAFAQVVAAGAADGLEFRFDQVASAPNTVDAHRLIMWAGEHGKQWELANALFAAYFTHGRNLNDVDQLVDVAAQVGLDPNAVRAFLATDEGVAAVQASQRDAAELGVQGVPFFVFNNQFAVSGAQPVQLFGRALDMAAEQDAPEALA